MKIRHHSGGFRIAKTVLATACTLLLARLVASATAPSLRVEPGASGWTQTADAPAVSTEYPGTGNGNKILTLSGFDDVVVKLTNFTLLRNARLTMHGTAATASDIHVSNSFSLTGGSAWDNVLFNVIGFTSLGRTRQLTGTILAPDRKMDVSIHAPVLGEDIANKVLHSGATLVQRPPIVGP